METDLNFGFTIRWACRTNSKLHNLQYDEGGNHLAETETETRYKVPVYSLAISCSQNYSFRYQKIGIRFPDPWSWVWSRAQCKSEVGNYGTGEGYLSLE